MASSAGGCFFFPLDARIMPPSAQLLDIKDPQSAGGCWQRRHGVSKGGLSKIHVLL
jgi:hypothetical protein